MEFASVGRRGNRLNLAIFALIIAIGLGANFVIGQLAIASDNILFDQIRLANLRAAVNLIPGSINALRLGETSLDLKKIRQNAAENFILLAQSVPNGDFRGVRSAFDQYDIASDRVQAAITSHNLDKAIHLQRSESDPAFDNLSRSLSDLNSKFDTEASAFRARSLTIKVLTFFFAGVLVAGMIIGLNRISISDAARERERHELEINGMRLSALVENNSDAILLTSQQGVVTLVNDACTQSWGLFPHDCVGKHIDDIFHSIDSNELFHAFERSKSNPREDLDLLLKVETKPGVKHTFQLHIRNLLDHQHLQGMLLTFHDVTQRAAVEEALTHQAFHDRLTGLANRSLVMARLGEALRHVSDREHEVALLFIDLDNFKAINDTLGHEMGDSLLIQVAERLQGTIRPTDMVARLGGDEFVVVLDGPDIEVVADAIAKRIVEQFGQPYQLGDRKVLGSASIGVAVCKDEGGTPNELLNKADEAMYHAKHAGKARYAIYHEKARVPKEELPDLESDLRSATARREFEFRFLPMITLADLKVAEVELLLRWQHPIFGYVPPNKFIPILEEIGIMSSVDDWVLTEACRQLLEWTSSISGLGGLKVCVNISGSQFLRSDFVNKVTSCLSDHKITPNSIQFDISECHIVSDLNLTRSICNSLRELGISTTIDDFGTGYGSMDYLKHLPVSGLKINRTIIEQLGEDSSADRIVRSIIDTGRDLGLRVIGEGIETVGQMQVLKSYGCEFGQGHIFQMPMSVVEMTRHLSQYGVGRGPSIL